MLFKCNMIFCPISELYRMTGQKLQSIESITAKPSYVCELLGIEVFDKLQELCTIVRFRDHVPALGESPAFAAHKNLSEDAFCKGTE